MQISDRTGLSVADLSSVKTLKQTTLPETQRDAIHPRSFTKLEVRAPSFDPASTTAVSLHGAQLRAIVLKAVWKNSSSGFEKPVHDITALHKANTSNREKERTALKSGLDWFAVFGLINFLFRSR